jgi:glutamyl endopeptidase
MATPGHIAVTNLGPQLESGRIIPEGAASPVTNRPSLPYYRAPARPIRRVNETAIIERAGEVQPVVALPDVAVASFSDTAFLEVVIGNDDRIKVAREFLSTNPWRQICSLVIHSQSGQKYVGTGWYIGPKALATAGHCVYLQDDGGWATSIDVTPAKFGSSAPFGAIRATRFAAVDGWTVQRQRDFDYGVILLDEDTAGRQVGNFEVRAFTDSLIANINAKISGYPADRERAQFQYFHERPVKEVTSSRIIYDIDTFGGQSGSPIWLDTDQHGVVAVGIHTTGGISSNSGTRINDAVLDNLITWVQG